MEIKLLETEIENARQKTSEFANIHGEKSSEGARLKKQIETMTKLKAALQIQLAGLWLFI